jgi:hypothetical protein
MKDAPHAVSLPHHVGETREHLTPFAAVSESPWVGSALSAIPATSAFGVLARLIRLNVLTPRDLFANFGLRLRRADDLSEVMTFSRARQAAFAEALGLANVPLEWNLSAWFPFRTRAELLRDPWSFRYCPACLATGYHTLLHQLPWFHECPWHRCALLTECPLCHAPTTTQADWLIDANLRCRTCGHDVLITERAISAASLAPKGAQAFLDAYLAQVAEQRTKSLLLIPDAPSGSHAALANLVGMQATGAVSRCSRDFEKVESLRAPQVKALDELESFRRLDVLHQDRPGFLQVPNLMRRAVARVACNLALKLPPHTLTDREMRFFMAGLGIEVPKGFQPTHREYSGSVSMLPPTSIAGQQYLNLTCLHPSTYRAASRLVDVAINNSLAMGHQGQVSPGEARVVLQACRAILCRGYAEGLRSVLSRHVPELYSMPRDRPHLSQPWVIVIFENGDLSAAHVVWRPIACVNSGEADVLDQADAANRRRQRAPARRRTRKRR